MHQAMKQISYEVNLECRVSTGLVLLTLFLTSGLGTPGVHGKSNTEDHGSSSTETEGPAWNKGKS